MGHGDVTSDSSAQKRHKRKNRRKRMADAITLEKINHDDGFGAVGTQVEDNEPTMADKLASLNIVKNDDDGIKKSQDDSHNQPPSANSVHVLLKQALHADDRSRLLDCLYNQDDKIISNTVSMLSPVDVFKLLDSLVSIIQSRGAVLVCALPWLQSLLLQHSSRIVSQESSLVTLNFVYQLIESRVATLKPALRLNSSLDFLFAWIDDDGDNEYELGPPVIYEDQNESEEEESEEDKMEADEESGEPEEFSGISDVDGSDALSD